MPESEHGLRQAKVLDHFAAIVWFSKDLVQSPRSAGFFASSPGERCTRGDPGTAVLRALVFL